MNQPAAQHKAAILTMLARAVKWNVCVEIPTADGLRTIPVRHPDRIEADGVRDCPGGLLFLVWAIGKLLRRIAIGEDTSNRAMERRMRRAVLGAFDPQYRPFIERLGMLDIMQIHEAIATAQRMAVSKAGDAMRQAMDDRAEDATGFPPSPQPSPLKGEGARRGPEVRQNADGSRTTLFELVPGQPIPGELTGGKKRIFGVPDPAQISERNSPGSAQPARSENSGNCSAHSVQPDPAQISARNSSNCFVPASTENTARNSSPSAQPDPSENSERNNANSSQPAGLEDGQGARPIVAQARSGFSNPRTQEGCG